MLCLTILTSHKRRQFGIFSISKITFDCWHKGKRCLSWRVELMGCQSETISSWDSEMWRHHQNIKVKVGDRTKFLLLNRWYTVSCDQNLSRIMFLVQFFKTPFYLDTEMVKNKFIPVYRSAKTFHSLLHHILQKICR